jgi:MOSC domain-containing protein YiiM
MKILSVNVGLPREVDVRSQIVRTSIFKAPVSGAVVVRRLNLEGDEQSDLTVHGGVDKAVYVYPSEHYPFWREELPEVEFPFGAFGENLTTSDLLEESVCIGDRFRAGSAEFIVSQPRLPCYKLSVRFDRADMVKRFLKSRRVGFYLRVAVEGELSAGDEITFLSRDERAVTVADIVHLYVTHDDDRALLQRASEVPALPLSWREEFRERLQV